MFTRIIICTLISISFFAQYTYADEVGVFVTPEGELIAEEMIDTAEQPLSQSFIQSMTAAETQVIYENTFDTDPNWITDQPENFYWDEAEKALFARTYNGNEDYTPNRFFYTKTTLDPTKSFTLTWDFKPMGTQSYTQIPFGLYADDLTMKNRTYIYLPRIISRSTLNTAYGLIRSTSFYYSTDIITENAYNHGGSGYGGSGELVYGTWYTWTMQYDAERSKVVREIHERDTGIQIRSGEYDVDGDIFREEMKNLGISMYPTGAHPTQIWSHHPDRYFEAYIDNVRLTGTHDATAVPTLENPTLHHPLDTTPITDGATVTHNTVTASGVITDPQGEAVQLELELKKTSESLDGTNTILSSTTTSSVTIDELIPKDQQYTEGGNTETFHYRMRARTEDGRTSVWTEPQIFTTKVVPLYTQVESNYPIVLEGEHWAGETFAAGKGDYVIYDTDGSIKEKGCGKTFAQCACAIASLTMLGHYYDIRTGVDGELLNPFTMDAWLVAHKSYTDKGGVWWRSALAYMGIQETDGTYASRLTLDQPGAIDRSLTDQYIAANNPVIVYNQSAKHYFVLDSKVGSTYTVRDPHWFKTVTLDDTVPTPNQETKAYGNKFYSAQLIGFHDTPQPLPAYIQAHLASPAELVLIAPDGNKLGFDPTTSTTYDEIPGGSYTPEGNIADPQSTDTPSHYAKNIVVPNPLEGAYTLKVIGTGSGPYTLSTRITDSALNGTNTTHVKDTSTGHVDTYELTFDPEGEGFTVKTIDELLTELRQTVYNTPAAAFMTMTTIRTKADAAHEYYAAGDIQQTIQTLKELRKFVKDHTGQDITPAQSEAIVTKIKAILVLLKA